jgi:hypothetical protein
MSVMGNLWLDRYERIADDFTRNVKERGEDYALCRAHDALGDLGLEVEDVMAELEALRS